MALLRIRLALLLTAACYQPDPPANAPCGPGGECPTGLVCTSGLCVPPGTVVEDAMHDAPPPIDAAPDAPNLSGCADGEREAFPSLSTYPTIAGCAATWLGAANLRAQATGAACGDDLGTCVVAADACAPGWHLCGTAGQPTELSGRATETECAGAGAQLDSRFVAAMSHCTDYCTYVVPLGCLTNVGCAEPVCCGAGCRNDAGCQAGVYTATLIAGQITEGCGALPSSAATGVLCCQ